MGRGVPFSFTRVRFSYPFFVTRKVSSKCTARPASAVTIVQPSLSVTISKLFSQIIVSIAMTIPGESFGPVPALAEIENRRFFVEACPDPMSVEMSNRRESTGFSLALDFVGEIADSGAGSDFFRGGKQALAAGFHEAKGEVGHISDRQS